MVGANAMETLLSTKRKMAKRDYSTYQRQYGDSVHQMQRQYLSPGALHQTPSLGADLDHLDAERAIQTDPIDNRKRRTLLLQKRGQSWGFTLQIVDSAMSCMYIIMPIYENDTENTPDATYGIKNKRTKDVEVMTYVDYIDLNSAAYIAGLRTGDVILSVNGRSVGSDTHTDLVSTIKSSGDQLRLVVLFEDCCHKVEMYDRIIRLKRVVMSKMKELRDLEFQEREIMDRHCDGGVIRRHDAVRQSMYSTASNSSWDRYSVLSSHITTNPKPLQSDSALCDYDASFLLNESVGLDDSYLDLCYADSDSDNSTGLNFQCDDRSVQSESLGRSEILDPCSGPPDSSDILDSNTKVDVQNQICEPSDEESQINSNTKDQVCEPSNVESLVCKPSNVESQVCEPSDMESQVDTNTKGQIYSSTNGQVGDSTKTPDIKIHNKIESQVDDDTEILEIQIHSDIESEFIDMSESRTQCKAESSSHSSELCSPIDIVYNPLIQFTLRKVKSDGHMENPERNVSENSEGQTQYGNTLNVPVQRFPRLSGLQEQRCASFTLLHAHCCSSADVVQQRHSLDNQDKSASQESVKPLRSPKTKKRPMTKDVDSSINIPFLHVGPIHVNERSEVTNL